MSIPLLTRSARTIDRRLVHRAQVHEVFVTEVDESSGWVWAQLPSCHAYFGDTPTVVRGFVDQLALMEAGRQAVTAAAHVFWGVPEGRQFVLSHLRARFPAEARPRVGERAIDLRMRVSLESERRMRGELSAGTTRVEVFDAGAEEAPVGEIELGLSYVSPEAYRMLREGARDRAAGAGAGVAPGAPRSTDIPRSSARPADPMAAEPGLVGCTREDNVAVGPPLTVSGEGRAALRLPFHNRSMFDHAQDHAPAMVLTEAARQLAYASSPEAAAAASMLVEVSGDFSSYVELDAEARLVCADRAPALGIERAEAPAAGTPAAGAPRPARTVDVRVEQGGRSASRLGLGFDVHPCGRAPGARE